MCLRPLITIWKKWQTGAGSQLWTFLGVHNVCAASGIWRRNLVQPEENNHEQSVVFTVCACVLWYSSRKHFTWTEVNDHEHSWVFTFYDVSTFHCIGLNMMWQNSVSHSIEWTHIIGKKSGDAFCKKLAAVNQRKSSWSSPVIKQRCQCIALNLW